MADLPRIGIALSSGGARGVYAHTGFLLALEQLGIPIVAASGCSAGAVAGGIAASGANLYAWSEALARLDPKRFWRPDPFPALFWKIVAQKGRGYIGLSGTESAVDFCRSQLAVQTFEECRYPFYILAVCLGRGGIVLFSKGELAPRMVASAAIPVLYRPVQIEDDWYCDGAPIELAPMDAICCKHNLDTLILHHVASRNEGRENLMRRLQRRWAMLEILDRVHYYQRPWYLSDEPLTFNRCPCGCGAVVIVIEPKLPELPWPMTRGGPQVQAAAREQTEKLLKPYLEPLLSDPRNRLPAPKEAVKRFSGTTHETCE